MYNYNKILLRQIIKKRKEKKKKNNYKNWRENSPTNKRA